ncbi:MAG: hypothetical protein LBI69_03305 [Puniceicoccales bacterium]|nr:hypothetical protein [Puniceicoccales bacterium]
MCNITSDIKDCAGVRSSKFLNELTKNQDNLIREIQIKTYVPLGITMLLSAAAIAVAVLCFPLSSAAAIGLFCVAAILVCGGIIFAVVVQGKKKSQILQLFMDNMKKLLEPYWADYKNCWQSWYDQLSDDDKKKFPQQVPGDLFQYPSKCDENALRRKFSHIADCFANSFYSKISDAEYRILVGNFVAVLSLLPQWEFKTLLTVPLDEKGVTLVRESGDTNNGLSRICSNIFMWEMSKLKIEPLRNCYLDLILSQKNKFGATRFSNLCYWGEDLELLGEILTLLANGKHVKLEHLLECAVGDTILDTATDNNDGKDVDSVSEKIWDFLCLILTTDDLEKLCLTKEENGNAAILNFLCSQGNFNLKEKCLEFIGAKFGDTEKVQLLTNERFLQFIYFMIMCKNSKPRDEIMDEIISALGGDRIKQYLQQNLKSTIASRNSEEAEEFTNFLSEKFKINDEIITKY